MARKTKRAKKGLPKKLKGGAFITTRRGKVKSTSAKQMRFLLAKGLSFTYKKGKKTHRFRGKRR